MTTMNTMYTISYSWAYMTTNMQDSGSHIDLPYSGILDIPRLAFKFARSCLSSAIIFCSHSIFCWADSLDVVTELHEISEIMSPCRFCREKRWDSRNDCLPLVYTKSK